MTLSLIGVTGIQAYWLNNAYRLKEEKFDREVGAAMSEVSDRLENLESVRFLSESFQIKPFFSEQLNPNLNLRQGDSSQPGEGELKLTMRLGDDTILVFDSQNQQSALTAYRLRDSAEREVLLTTKPEDLFNKGLHLDMVLRKMVLHEMRRQEVGEVVPKAVLDSLLRFELKSRGIELPYQFAVISESEIELSSELWNPQQNQHTAALFPNGIFNQQVLSLSFPSKANYLFRSMWIMLLVSLIFTAAIIFAFYRTLSFSLRQKRISEIKTDFINNMTHEFKTPLATINLAIDALGNPKVKNDPEKISHYSGMIKQENQRMNLQVESVLRMALMDKQELDLNLKPTLVREVVQECIDHVSLQLENKNGQLTSFFNDEGARVLLDRNHLSNAIINVLDNAIKYAQGSPQIKLVTEATLNHFILIISDRGIGMTKEEQKHIFDRFYRVSAGDLHNIKGHGLGLSYTKGIVEAHQGRIEVESEKGKGSKFYIYLPLDS